MHRELGTDLDRPLQAARDGTEASVEAVDTLDLGSPLGRHGQAVAHGDALDDENLLVEDDVSDGLDFVALRIDVDVTRFQRGGEGARQSAAGGRHDVVERRRAGREVLGVDAVVLGHRGVDAEHDGLGLGRQVREAVRTAVGVDADARDVRGVVGHRGSLRQSVAVVGA